MIHGIPSLLNQSPSPLNHGNLSHLIQSQSLSMKKSTTDGISHPILCPPTETGRSRSLSTRSSLPIPRLTRSITAIGSNGRNQRYRSRLSLSTLRTIRQILGKTQRIRSLQTRLTHLTSVLPTIQFLTVRQIHGKMRCTRSLPMRLTHLTSV